MPPAMADILDIWAVDSQIASDCSIPVDFLLPTGIYIQLEVPREATISYIKQVMLPCKIAINIAYLPNHLGENVLL